MLLDYDLAEPLENKFSKVIIRKYKFPSKFFFH